MRQHLGLIYTRVRDAMMWRLHRLLGDRIVYDTLLATARGLRKLMNRPDYIGITGSAGKTTSKELLLGILSLKGKGVGNAGSLNNIEEVAKAMLRLRPTHSFFVTEISGHRVDVMSNVLELVQPCIGIVTVISDDHSSPEYTREDIAKTKSNLISQLPPTGTAVLNADDELVSAMAAKCAGEVITYGTSAGAALRAKEIQSLWPERLEFTLTYGAQEARVKTQLCGVHWIPTVLGAIGGGLAMRLSLVECVAGVEHFSPFDGRMQPVTTKRGVTFVRDDFKAPLWTFESCFQFMQDARAERKIIVIGSVSDGSPAGKSKDIQNLAVKAQQIADHVVFVGAWASSALKAVNADGHSKVRTFSHVRDASIHLNEFLQRGDLVLLKGTNKQDHLVRTVLAVDGEVACWREDCEREDFCEECPHLTTPSGPGGVHLVRTTVSDDETDSSISYPLVERDEQVVVGLGNPDEQFRGTPHNIGYEVVDLLAGDLQLDWIEIPEGWVARGKWQDRNISLIKIKQPMNLIGGGLKQLAEHIQFRQDQCILVFDDLALPLGTVRKRLSGSAGGHRGVASILEAFQTDQFRRIKVGIKPAENNLENIEYVLRVFDVSCREKVDAAIRLAKNRCLEIVSEAPKAPATKGDT